MGMSSWFYMRKLILKYLLWCIACSCREKVVSEEIPANMEDLVTEKRRELIEVVSEVDDKLAEAFLNDEPISSIDLEVSFWEIFDQQILNLVFSALS